MALLALLVGLPSAALPAQLAEGAMVRWRENRAWIEGRILPRAAGDTAWQVQAIGGPGLTDVPRRLWPTRTVGDPTPDLQRRVSPSRRGKGALLGLGAGAMAGAIIGLASGDETEWCWFFCSASEKAAVYAIGLAPIGALVGAAAAPGSRWESVSPRPVARTGLYFGREGVGLQLSF